MFESTVRSLGFLLVGQSQQQGNSGPYKEIKPHGR
jgi:hypothetical protein